MWRCPFREFEGILQEIDTVDVVAPYPGKWYAQGKRAACRLGEYLKKPLNPGIPAIALDRDYDVFLTIIEKPSEMLHVTALRDLRKRCRTLVCWIVEFYLHDIPTFKSVLEVMSQFDHVVFMTAAYEPFHRIVEGQCSYLAAGVDALRFCPFPNAPKRVIDVLSIGRRAEESHQELLKFARDEELFYVYDTFSDLHSHNLEHHRAQMANLSKRSRYFIVNPGKVNVPEETGGQSEFGYRYFEGAAPGAILVGERPRNNREFGRIFHWKDAVIDLPFGSDRIGEIIRELDRQPERQVRIRRNNMLQVLLHHDWVYRWETIHQLSGLQPLPALQERKERLQKLAALVEREPIEA